VLVYPGKGIPTLVFTKKAIPMYTRDVSNDARDVTFWGFLV